jgi:hypothetical protein
MILKLFPQKILAKKLTFFAQAATTFCKKLIIHWFLRKRQFFAEN